MIKLYLMRHGEAEVIAGNDAQRALTAHGKKQAQQVGAWLANKQVELPLVCHSPFLRAQQTADEVLACLPAAQRQVLDVLVPSSSPEAVAEALDRLGAATVLCVSHQPLVGELRNWLVDASPGAGFPFATAGIALLECEMLAPGSAEMKWILGPADFD